MFSNESVRRVVRTFVVSFLALFIPGLLGWLNALTEWARSEGATPFPDAHGLLYVAVSAITAAVIAAVQLAWNWVEDVSGKGFLREVPPRQTPGQQGRTDVLYAALVVLVVVFIAVLVF